VGLLLLLSTASLLAGKSMGLTWLVGVLVVWPACCVGHSMGVLDSDLGWRAAAIVYVPGVAHLVLLFIVGGFAGTITSTGVVVLCCFLALKLRITGCRSGSRWTVTETAGVLFALAAFLTVVPAALVSTSEVLSSEPSTVAALGSLGVFIFAAVMWALGWAFLWHRGDKLNPVETNQHLQTMPSKLALKLKHVTVVLECYNYCGFSFFPALPWKAMQVPPSVPHPQAVMLAGFSLSLSLSLPPWRPPKSKVF
jgi:hypothetical protein